MLYIQNRHARKKMRMRGRGVVKPNSSSVRRKCGAHRAALREGISGDRQGTDNPGVEPCHSTEEYRRRRVDDEQA